MRNTNNKIEEEFLRQSNAIEGVWGDEPLEQALVAWNYLKKQKKLDHGVLLKTHKLLMLNQPLLPNERGYYRTIPVYIGTQELPDPKLIRPYLDDWLNYMNSDKQDDEYDFVRLHVAYEMIHPFVDGNGRTGRMFMNWYRLKWGQDILVINRDERHDYYEWFRDEDLHLPFIKNKNGHKTPK